MWCILATLRPTLVTYILDSMSLLISQTELIEWLCTNSEGVGLTSVPLTFNFLLIPKAPILIIGGLPRNELNGLHRWRKWGYFIPPEILAGEWQQLFVFMPHWIIIDASPITDIWINFPISGKYWENLLCQISISLP